MCIELLDRVKLQCKSGSMFSAIQQAPEGDRPGLLEMASKWGQSTICIARPNESDPIDSRSGLVGQAGGIQCLHRFGVSAESATDVALMFEVLPCVLASRLTDCQPHGGFCSRVR